MIQVIGWLGFIASISVILSGVLAFGISNFPLGIISLVLGFPMLFWGSSVKKYKKWTWYFGVIWYSTGILYYIYVLITKGLDLISWFGLAYSILVVVVLVMQKNKFFVKNEPIQTAANTPSNNIAATPVVMPINNIPITSNPTVNSPMNAVEPNMPVIVSPQAEPAIPTTPQQN